MSKGPKEVASALERLLPQLMMCLFRPDGPDPLGPIPMGQLRLLRILQRGPKTASELGSFMGLSPSALTQMANRLVTAGLVEKADDDEDRRMRWLSLSSKGQELMEVRHHKRVKSAVEVLKGIPSDRQEELVTIIREIISSSDMADAAHQPAVTI